jgi:lysozyme family protein
VLHSRLTIAVIAIVVAGCDNNAPPTSPKQYHFQPGTPVARTIVPVRATPTPAPTPKKIIGGVEVVPQLTGWAKIQADRWGRAEIRPEKRHFVIAIATKIQQNRARYESVSAKTRVPWKLIGCLHNMEASLDWRTNLANGDPLTARTRHVPRGRPTAGAPPFTWEIAAIDALVYDELPQKQWGDIGHQLNNCELYNGPYYQKHNLVSPYIHSWDTLYVRGKIVEDGVYSPTAVSQQCGVVPILKILGQ